MKFEQVMVVGAGSVGGFFGAHLAKNNPHVSFLLRPKTLAAVQEHGLIIKSATGTLTVRPKASSDPQDLPRPDLVILAVKAYDLDQVMDQLAPVLTDQTVILTLQNGVDTEDRLIARLERDCVVGGVAYIYSKIVQPGVIEHYKRGSVSIGEMMGHESPRVSAIVDLFTQAGVPCHLAPDVRKTKWEKMCWNCVFNPLTVMIDDRIAKAMDHPDMLRVIHQIVEEVCAVSAACKVPLQADMADKVLRWSQEIRDIHTSMYDDWKAGRPTEIESLNGYIVARGREFGIPTPVNEALSAMIKVITAQEPTGPGVLRIEGAVVQPISLTRQALRQLPEAHQVPDVSTLMPSMKGRGIRVAGLLDVPALAVGADHVTVHAADGQFYACLTVQQAREFGVLVYEQDGGPLPDQRGGPFRLITPGLGDLCANVKNVGRLELTKGLGPDNRPSLQPNHTAC
jgi:2-dehydropantoate 2-reductase